MDKDDFLYKATTPSQRRASNTSHTTFLEALRHEEWPNGEYFGINIVIVKSQFFFVIVIVELA
jgi:hypothetical protein